MDNTCVLSTGITAAVSFLLGQRSTGEPGGWATAPLKPGGLRAGYDAGQARDIARSGNSHHLPLSFAAFHLGDQGGRRLAKLA
jgi:hypothetical protein